MATKQKKKTTASKRSPRKPAKSKSKKPAKPAKRRRHNHKGKYDWDALRTEYRHSGMKIIEFAQSKGIPLGTIRKHIRAADKTKRMPSSGGSDAEKFEKQIENATIAETKNIYIESLTRSHIFIRQMVNDLAKHWSQRMEYQTAFRDANEIGRLAVLVTDRLRETAVELQGIPDDDSTFGWPLTKSFWPFEYQRDFVFDLPSAKRINGKPAFHFAFVGGIGSGKTRCGAEKFGDIAFRNRGCMCGVFAPTYRMLEDSTKRVFLDVVAKKGIAFKYMPSENAVLLFGDTKVIFRSMDNPEHIRGPELGASWIDEGGQMSTRKPADIIAGRVRDPNAMEPCVLHTTTPNGFNWFYTMTVEESDQNRCIVYHAKTAQNRALDAAYVERLSDMYDERFALQELCGEFIDVFVGKAYWNFERGESVTDEYEYDAYLPMILSFDLNVDPMCWNITQRFRSNGYEVSVVLDEIHLRTSSTDDALNEFKRRYGDHKAGLHIYGDSTWRSRKSTATTRTDYDVIKSALSKMPGLEIHVGRSNPAITDSVAAVNAQLRDSHGRRKLLVHPRCKHTIRDFERVSFKEGTRELNKKSKDYTHHTDNIRYYIATEFPIRKPVVTMY